MKTKLLLYSLFIGLIYGVFLAFLTVLLNHTYIQWDRLSLAGNEVLIIPLGVGSAVIAGSWAACVYGFHDRSSWLRAGLTYGMIGIVLAVGSLLTLALQGQDGGAIFTTFGILSIVWIPLSPLLAYLRIRSTVIHDGFWWFVSAGLILFISTLSSFVVTSLISFT